MVSRIHCFPLPTHLHFEGYVPLSSLRNFSALSSWWGTRPKGAPPTIFGREASLDTTLQMLDGVEEELMARSFLFVDPVSYRDGVEATTQAVRAMLVRVNPAGTSPKKLRKDAS